MAVKYRPNVAGILRDSNGKILVGERLKQPGAWQFPQGGVDPQEDAHTALARELEEEIGLSPKLYRILQEKGGYRYEFPGGRLKFGIYGGQEQTYFLCQFLGQPDDIRIDTAHPEFRAVRWIDPQTFDFKWLPPFKEKVYRQVFRDFFSPATA